MKTLTIIAFMLISLMASLSITGLASAVNLDASAKQKLLDAEISANANGKVDGKSLRANSAAEAKAESAGFSAKDVRKKFSEIDSSVNASAKESTFANVYLGGGWATTNTEGHLIRVFWVSKSFLNNNSEREMMRSKGTIKLDSENAYKLSLISVNGSNMVFEVQTNGNKKTNGTLEIKATKSLTAFTVWSGTMKLDSGKNYDIQFATRNRRVSGSADSSIDSEVKTAFELEDNSTSFPGAEGQLNAATQGNGKKVGLFARLKTFFG